MKMQEPSRLAAEWYSRKTNGACVRYEEAISFSGELDWKNCPGRARESSDLEIFRRKLTCNLMCVEKIIASETCRLKTVAILIF